MAPLESLMQAIEVGRQRQAAQKQKEEASRFNVGSALIPSIVALAAAPFTGGTSLAALGKTLGATIPKALLAGAGQEAVRAGTVGQPFAQQLGSAAVQGVTEQAFPSAETLETRETAKRKPYETVYKGLDETQKLPWLKANQKAMGLEGIDLSQIPNILKAPSAESRRVKKEIENEEYATTEVEVSDALARLTSTTEDKEAIIAEIKRLNDFIDQTSFDPIKKSKLKAKTRRAAQAYEKADINVYARPATPPASLFGLPIPFTGSAAQPGL